MAYVQCSLIPTKINIQFVTGSLNGGWVPQTSRSFHSSKPELLDETAPMAGKSWQPSHEPHTEGKKGTHHTDIICTVETTGKGSNLETMLKGRTTNAWGRSTCLWTTEDGWLHGFINTFSRKCNFEGAWSNTAKPLGNALTPERYPYGSASQNTAGQEGMLNALVCVHNNSVEPQGNTKFNALCS